MPTARAIFKKMETMKTLPNIAVRLTRMISEDDADLQAFEEVIKLDPILVLRLLKIVNSPYYALASKVESIAEAVAFVGMDNLRNLIVMDIFKHIIASGPDEFNAFMVNLWRHSAAVGVASQMISERVFQRGGENAFLCGLIHDIGLIIEAQVVPDLFLNVYSAWTAGTDIIVPHERREIGADHTEVGWLIVSDWQLPKPVCRGVRDHHKTVGDLKPESMISMVRIAEYLVNRMDFAPPHGPSGPLPQLLLNHMRQRISDYKAVAMDLPGALENADQILRLE